MKKKNNTHTDVFFFFNQIVSPEKKIKDIICTSLHDYFATSEIKLP